MAKKGLTELISQGLLKDGDVVVWKRRSGSVEATIKPPGLLVTADSVKHKTPSGAAKHLNGDKPVDGWLAWRLKSTGKPISSLRDALK